MLLASACLEHAWNGAAKKTLWIWGGTDAHPAVSPIALSFLPHHTCRLLLLFLPGPAWASP